MAESDIRTAIMTGLIKPRQFDGYAVHGSGLQRVGEPDITGEVYLNKLGIWGHVKFEVKKDTKPSVIQRTRLRQYHQRGYIVGIVYSLKDATAIIDSYERFWDIGLNYVEPLIDILTKNGYTVEYPAIYGG